MKNSLKDFELTDDQMEKVVGGVSVKITPKKNVMKVACFYCKTIMDVDMSLSEVKCKKCRKINTFAG